MLRRFVYRHPLYTREAIGAQRRWREVSGVNRTHYCGAYWFYGFHEDGLNSALRVAARARGRVVIDSGLFVGTLRHRRFAPVAHAFTYPLFMALLDIDRLPELMRVSRLTSYNRWNWASFDDRDHLGDPARPLRERLAVDARRHGIESAGRSHLPADAPALSRLRLQPGVVLLLLRRRRAAAARPRRGAATPSAARTTTGCGRESARRTFRAAAAKSLYVSPFMPVDLDYAFAFTPPAGHGSSRTWKRSGRARSASTRRCRSNDGRGARRRSGGRSLRYPAMTANVMAGIHWQALKLWWKGVPLVRRVTRDGVGERAAWDAGRAAGPNPLKER